MKVLVTGASGFVGSRLVAQLLDQGHRVRALASGPADTGSASQAASAERVCGRLPDRALSHALCQGVDAVVHAAGTTHTHADLDTLRRDNFDATLELAHAARDQGVRKFVFISSSKARWPDDSAYARVKVETERALGALHEPGNFEVVSVRPALVYGVGMRGNLRTLLELLNRSVLPVFPASAAPVGMIGVNDLACALVKAVEVPSLPDQPWELSDGHAYTLDSLVRTVRSARGLAAPMLTLPRAVVKAACALAPLFGSSISPGTYRALYDEPYTRDTEFSRRTGFVAQDTFESKIPEMLEGL